MLKCCLNPIGIRKISILSDSTQKILGLNKCPISKLFSFSKINYFVTYTFYNSENFEITLKIIANSLSQNLF